MDRILSESAASAEPTSRASGAACEAMPSASTPDTTTEIVVTVGAISDGSSGERATAAARPSSARLVITT